MNVCKINWFPGLSKLQYKLMTEVMSYPLKTGKYICYNELSVVIKSSLCNFLVAEVETEAEENPLIAVLVAVSVVSIIVITVLSLLLAKFVFLYFKYRRFGSTFGDSSYTRYTIGKYIVCVKIVNGNVNVQHIHSK